MKIRNIFLTVAFVFGTAAIIAQTKVYFHKADGTSDEYNIADIDSVDFAPAPVVVPAGSNLIVNPGFEIGDDNKPPTIAPWQLMTGADIAADAVNPHPVYGTPAKGSGQSNIENRSDPEFYTRPNRYVDETPVIAPHDGRFAGRLTHGSTAGLYQLIDVTPGKTYAFSAWFLRFRGDLNETIRQEFMRIKTADGATTLEKAAFGSTDMTANLAAVNTWAKVSGTVTIPDGVTQVRFQVSQIDYPAPYKSAGTLFDDCEFYEVQ